MSELLAQAVDICRKLIGEKTTPEINEIEAAITNITLSLQSNATQSHQEKKKR